MLYARYRKKSPGACEWKKEKKKKKKGTEISECKTEDTDSLIKTGSLILSVDMSQRERLGGERERERERECLGLILLSSLKFESALIHVM